MISKLLMKIKYDAFSIVKGIIFTLFSFSELALWRHFNPNIFSFHQILIICFMNLIFLYLLETLKPNSFTSFFHGKELIVVLISFLIVSFLVLNVDRSRSFYLIRWVEISEPHGTSIYKIADKYDLSNQEVKDFNLRIREQVSSGTISISRGTMHLTLMGKLLANLFSFTAKFESLNGYPKA